MGEKTKLTGEMLRQRHESKKEKAQSTKLTGEMLRQRHESKRKDTQQADTGTTVDSAYDYAIELAKNTAGNTSVAQNQNMSVITPITSAIAAGIQNGNIRTTVPTVQSSVTKSKKEQYQERKANALSGLSEDALATLDKYNSYEQAREGTMRAGMLNPDDLGRVETMHNYSDMMSEAKEELITKYGISEEDFYKIAQYRKEDTDAAHTEDVRKQIAEDIEAHPVAAGAAYTALDVLSSPLHGIMAGVESLKRKWYADTDAPVNTNSVDYAMLNFANATEQAVNDQIDNPIGDFAYNVGTSAAKSAVSMLSGGGVTNSLGLTGKAAKVVGNLVTLPQFGTSAYASTLQADQAKGIDTDQAQMHAAAAGISEMLFEVVSLDHVWDIARKGGKTTAKQMVKDILVQAGIEGSEEGMTDIANHIADNIINGNQSDYNMNISNYIAQGYSEDEAKDMATKDFLAEVAQDALAGAASGGLMGGGATVSNYVSYNRLGDYVNANTELKQSVVEAAQTMAADTTAKELVENKTIEQLSGYDMGRIMQSMEETSGQEMTAILEERFVELGENTEQAKKDAAEVVKAVSTPSEEVGVIENARRTKQFEKNDNLATVYCETLEGEYDNQAVQNKALSQVQKAYAAEQQYKKASKVNNTSVARAVITETADPVIVAKMEDVGNGNPTVRLSDKRIVDLATITIEDPVKQQLYNFASTMETPQVANAVIEHYKGESLHTYAESCAVFYNAGKLGAISFDSLINNPKNSRLVSNISNIGTLKLMYVLGENSRSAKKSEVAPVQQEKTDNIVKKEGKLVDNRTDKTDDRIAVVAAQVAKKTGLEITLNDALSHGENGHFQKALSRIALSSEATNEYATLVHEINEFAESYNPEGMKQVIDTVLDYAQTKEGAAYLTKTVQGYQNAYKRVETDKTYEDSAEEFVFDYLAGVFSQKEGVEDFCRYMTEDGMTQQEQKGILQTIADFFRGLAEKIMSYLDEHVLSSVAEKGLQADADRATEIRKMVMEVWQQAEENYHSDKGMSENNEIQFSLSEEEYSAYKQMEDEKLYEFAKASREGKNQKKAYFKISNEIDERLANDIERTIGVNVKGYGNEISNNGIKHIEKEHGREGRTDRSMQDLHDLARIPYAINGYEKIRKGKYSREFRCETVELQKRLGDRFYYVVEAVPIAKHKTLHVVSAYINKNDTFSGVAVSNDPSRYVHDEPQSNESFSNNIISHNTENATKNYSLDVDSEGRTLSEVQQAYFKDSKVRDESGRLLVTYHGTKADFTVFDIGKNKTILFGEGFYFGENRDAVKEHYAGDNGKVMGVYLNIRNPFVIEKSQLKNIEAIPTAIGESLGIDGVKKEDIREVLKKHGYDGVHYINRGNDVYVAFEPNQIKNVDNLNPTEDEDIRYSVDVDAFSKEYDAWDKKNPTLTFKVGYTSEALKKIGIEEKYITMDSSKIIKIKAKHASMSDSVIKKLPMAISDPIFILESKQSDSRIVLGGELQDDDGNTVVVILELNPTNRKGLVLDEIKVASAYGKNKMQRFLDESKLLYVCPDKKRTSRWMTSTRLQLPVESLTTDSIDSIPQNSQKSTKNYSIDVDNSLFESLQETYSAQEQEMASIVQEGFASLKKVIVDERVMHRIAYKIRKEYQSKCDIDKLTENLTRVFAYLKEHADNVGYADMVRIVQEIAKPVIEESTDVDPYAQEIYGNFCNFLKGKSIRLSEEQKAEVAYYYGSYENFRKRNFGNITFSDKGTYLDSLWGEICDNSYQMLDYEISSADQPISLIDALNALRPVKKNIYGMDAEQAAYDLAFDIYRRFFVEQGQEQANKKVFEKTDRLIVRQQEYRKRVKKEYNESFQRLRDAEKQKREALVVKYEQKIHDLKEDQKAMLEYKDMKAYNASKKQTEWYRDLVIKTKLDANKRLLEIKATNRQSMMKKRYIEETRKYRERIKKNARGIIVMFNKNTDKKHVPEILKDTVAEFITSLEWSSNRSPDSAEIQEWQQSLNQMYRKLSDRKAAIDGGYIELYDALHDWENGDQKASSLLSDMSNFIDSNSGTPVFDMNLMQLQQLDELIAGLKRVIAGVNQLYVNKRTQSVQELGSRTVQELEGKKDRKSRTRLGEVAENLLEMEMLDPRSYFYRLGDSAFSIYEELRTAFSERVWLLKEAQDYMEKELQGLNIKMWTGDNAEVHTIMVRGQELKMTTGQIMSLYELNKRYQANMHIKYGGIRPSKIGKGKKSVERITPVKLSDYEIDLICQKLTPEQRRVADAMQKFLSDNCADWGNKASMLMYGYKRFGAANYFPIKTDGNSVDTRDNTKFFATKNQGFTKETMNNARNALIVDDIFDVFTKHVTDMASYSTFSAPLMDAMKWFNYRSVADEGEIVAYGVSVKSEIERVYGRTYLEYFQKLIQDINAETTKGIESQISDTLTSRMKAASVGANLRVAVQQPSAYFRAMAVMNPKYLLKAVAKKSAMKKAKENSAITLWKSWGYFETSIGMSMKNIITGQDSWRNKIVEKSMWLSQKADDFTWGYLWNACEAEIKDRHPKVEYNSDEFLKLTAGRFDEVVDQTQVVDSVLHRSHIMRSNDGIAKAATSFMAEPTKSYNMLMNKIRDIKEGGGKHAKNRLARAVVAYTATSLLNAVLVSFVDAARDSEDDDDTYMDNYVQALKENVWNNLNPIGIIPYVKDLLSMFQGYDVSRMDMEGISNVIAGGQSLYRYCMDEDYRKTHTLFDTSKALLRGVSQVCGTPMYNLVRDFEAIYNTFTGEHLGGIKRSNKRNYERMTDAILEGDTKKYEDAREGLRENEVGDMDVQSGLKSYVKKQMLEGLLTEDDVKKIFEEEYGADELQTEGYISEWKCGDIESKFKDEAISEEEAKKQLQEEVEMNVEDAEQQVTGWKIDVIKDDYLNGWISEEEAKEGLEQEGELSDEEIILKIKEWNYKKENPLSKYTQNSILFEAIDYAYETGKTSDRGAIRTEITSLLESGKEKSDIERSITSHYKKEFLELKAAGKSADMKNLLISTYMMLGLTQEEALNKINAWE